MVRNRQNSTMESSLNIDSWRSSTKTENTGGTMNRSIGEIRKSINGQFNADIRTFIVNKYPGRQMKPKISKKREINISNRWTTLMEEPAPIPLPQMKPQKQDPHLK